MEHVPELSEVQNLVRPIAHWFDAETEVPVIYRHLSRLARGACYVEIGTGLGCSAITAALSSREGVAIWTFDIGTQYVARLGSLVEYERKVREWFEKYDVAHRVEFVVGDANEYPWLCDIDVLFVDGDHAYESVAKDIAAWMQFVNRGGVALFHDYHCVHTPGVKQAVDEWQARDGVRWQGLEGGGSIVAYRRLLYD